MNRALIRTQLEARRADLFLRARFAPYGPWGVDEVALAEIDQALAELDKAA